MQAGTATRWKTMKENTESEDTRIQTASVGAVSTQQEAAPPAPPPSSQAPGLFGLRVVIRSG